MLDFINTKNELLSIGYDASYVIYNQIKYTTNIIYMFSESNIKLTFDTFLIKYSKGELNLYNGTKMIDTFNKIESNTTSNTTSNLVFELNHDYLIELNENYILNCDVKEIIVNITKIGLYWTEYTTELGNKLTISSNTDFHNKFNGIPIGKIN
jgi:hypothetical protein